jgi:3-deoxy-manno-octulosonate cytidylyltransferase (CMP-KDO synthetase)
MKKNNYLVVIPSRMESTRLPRKPLIDIAGKSLIQRTCEQVAKAIPIENFLVATNHNDILNHVRNLGYNAELTSNDCLTGTDRVAEIASRFSYDHYINVQGDEPLINPNDILKIISFTKKFPDDVLNGYAIIDNTEDYFSNTIPKVVFRPDKRLLYMSRANIPGNKEAVFEKSWKQVCIYAFPKQLLEEFKNNKTKTALEKIEDIEILRFLELGFEVRMIELDSNSIAVDVPEDINKVLKKLNEY